MYKIVITSEKNREMVSAVPETWEKDNVLNWPPVLKQSLLENLKKDKSSVPSRNWKKIPCKVKMRDIKTYEEAQELEEFFSNSEPTDDEELPVHKERSPVPNYKMDFNNCIYTLEDNGNPNPNELVVQEEQVLILQPDENIASGNQETISFDKELENLKTCFNSLKEENLKLQVKVDKVLENQEKILQHLENLTYKSNIEQATDFENVGIKFPLSSVDDINSLEKHLMDESNFKKMVTSLSRVCGTSGSLKLNKVGLMLFNYMFDDEVINKYTWRGVSGTNKHAFLQLGNLRKLLYEVLLLADKSCTLLNVDSFIQNSALKHSGQRIKRKVTQNSRSRRESSVTSTQNSVDQLGTETRNKEEDNNEIQ